MSVSKVSYPEPLYPVNPQHAGIPNLEVTENAGYLAIGNNSRQELLGKWATYFPPVKSLSELSSKEINHCFLVQLVAGEDCVAIYVESDLLGFISKPPRQKFIESIALLKQYRFPTISRAFFVGDMWVKYGLRVQTTGFVMPQLLKSLKVDADESVNADKSTSFFSPSKLSVANEYFSAETYKLNTNNIFWSTLSS